MTSHRSGSSTVFWTAAAVALVLVRAVLWAAYARTPIPFGPLSDSWVYLSLARGWNASGTWGAEAAFHSPLYPYVLGLVLRLGGDSSIAMLLLQNLLGIASSLLILVWVRRFTAAGWIRWTLLGLLVVSSPWISHEWRLFPVTAAMTLELLLLETAYRLFRRRPGKPGAPWTSGTASDHAMAALVAFLIGLLILLRPNFAVLVPVAGGAGLWAAARHRLPFSFPVAWILVPLLMAAPFLARNQSLVGAWSLSANSGITFYQGNNPRATGGYSRVEGVSSDVTRQNLDAREAAPEAGTAAGADRHWWREGLTYLLSHPLHAAGLWGRKLLLFIGPVETGGDIPFSFERRQVPVLTVFGLVRFSLILALGIVGLFRLPPYPFPRLLLLTLLAIPLLSNLVFYMSSRYRLPAWPLWILLAGLGLEEIRRTLAARRQGEPLPAWRLPLYGGLAAAGVIATVAGLLAPPSLSARVAGWSNWGIAATHAGRPAEAARAFTELRALEPDDRENLENLGLAYLRSGQLPEAEACFGDLVRRHPESFAGYNNLAYVYLAQARWLPARDAARRALALRPGETSASFILAEAAVRLRRFDEACEALQNITRFPAAYDHLRRVKEQCEKLARRRSASPDR